MKMGLDRLEEKIPPTLSQAEPQPMRRSARGNERRDSEKTGLWAQACSAIGAAVWAALALLARVGIVRLGAVELIFLFAPLAVVPLGMELARTIDKS